MVSKKHSLGCWSLICHSIRTFLEIFNVHANRQPHNRKVYTAVEFLCTVEMYKNINRLVNESKLDCIVIFKSTRILHISKYQSVNAEIAGY